MKSKYYILVLLFFAVNFNLSAKKIALIVAVSEYENAQNLNTEQDVLYVKKTLMLQGFDEKDIVIIKDKEVTSANLIKYFKSSLIDKAKQGDVAFFHFSGHGQQIMDTDGDEADGYDEALVCHQAQGLWGEKGYRGEEHFTDDQLNKLLLELRKKIGNNGSVLVMIDACFSGTMLRANETIRGNAYALAPDYYDPQIKTSSITCGGGLEFNKDNDLAPVVLFAASKQDEPNFETLNDEGKPIGSLSYAFAKAVNSDRNLKTYQGVFDYMKVIMSSKVPNQTPQAEGDLNVNFLGKGIFKQQKYFKIKEVSDKKIILDAGNIAGIFEGAVLGFYPIDTQKSKATMRKAKAEVISATGLEAELKLETPLSKKELLNSWVFVEEQTYGSMKVNVLLSGNLASDNEVKKIMKKNPVIRFIEQERSQTADIIIRDSIAKYGDQQLFFDVKNDSNKYVKTISEYSYKEIVNTIEDEVMHFSKSRYLKMLELYNPNIQIKLELLPVLKYEAIAGVYTATEFGKQEDKMVNGQINFKEKDLFIFKVQNQGSRTAYFQIMDIQPDNNVSILVPAEQTSPGDIKIEAGQTIIFTTFIMQIQEPLGNDIFKIIASPEPMNNLRNIVETPKQEVRATKTPFEMLTHSITGGTRAAKPFAVPVNTVSTYSVSIRTSK